MVDDDATTDTPMTPSATAVGTATVQPPAPGLEPVPHQAPVPPPPIAAPVDEVLRWLANVVTMAGPPDGVDLSTTTRHVEIATPNPIIHTRWQAIIGAVAQPARPDALGAMLIAMSAYRALWSVTIRTHVSHGGVTP